MKKLLIVLAIVVTFAGVWLSQNAASAQQDEERITLSPAVARPELQAGQKAGGKLTIINDGTVPYTFLLYARPFSVNNEAYEPNYTEVNERTEAYQWVQFNKTKLSLQPGDRVSVGYTVTVPEKAAPGGHYAVLFAETQPKDEQANVSRKKRVGSLLYMTVDGKVIEQGEVTGWDAARLQTKPPLTSSVRIANSGNVHFQATATVSYSNIFGKKQFEKNQEVLVLPGTTRRIVFEWANTPYFGIFKASGQVNVLGSTENLEQKWVVLFPQPLMIIIMSLIGAGVLWFVVKPRVQKRKLKTNKTHEGS